MNIVIKGGPIFVGNRDDYDYDRAVLIIDDKIKAVGLESEFEKISDDIEILDLKGRTLMPGMIDAHCHMISHTELDVNVDLIVTGAIEGVAVANNVLRSGITTVRDPGCKHLGVFTLKRLINEGFLQGPNIFAAGPNPTGAAAPEHWRNVWVDGEVQMRHAVRELKRQGVDWIKFVVSCQSRADLWSRTDKYLTFEELRAGVDEARQYGYRVSGHVEGLDAAQMVVKAGFSGIEHGTVIDEALADVMAERDIFYVPTLLGFDTMSTQEIPLYPFEKSAFDARAAEHKRSFQRALAAGVTIAVGTDTNREYPIGIFIKELQMFTQYGMTNAQALQAATINGAKVLGKANIFGSIAPDMQADLVIVDGDPLRNLESLLHIDMVMKSGKEMKIS